MSITFEATYENGVLRPAQPLPLKEHERVRVTVDSGAGWAERTRGLLAWKGDAAALDEFVLDADLEYEP